MLPTRCVPGDRARHKPLVLASTRPDTGRLKRLMEGISLWLAMLLLLFVQPIFAEASAAAGELRFIDVQGRHLESATLIAGHRDTHFKSLKANGRLRYVVQAEAIGSEAGAGVES